MDLSRMALRLSRGLARKASEAAPPAVRATRRSGRANRTSVKMSRMPSPNRQRQEEQAHDVLAAEEFGMPAPDPALHRDEAHDMLAAEEFGMPAPDPVLHHHQPVTLPSDPTGIAEPHDVLAAEEFAMPAGRPAVSGLPAVGTSDGGWSRILVAAGALGLLFLRRRRRRARRPCAFATRRGASRGPLRAFATPPSPNRHVCHPRVTPALRPSGRDAF